MEGCWQVRQRLIMCLGMGFRFRRRIRVAPGVTLNLSKRGSSWSFGQRGYHMTVGHGHVRQTVGIPGTGLYWTSVSGGGRRQTRQVASRAVRRAPPPAQRPAPTPEENRRTAITCLLIVFVIATAGLGLIPIAIWAIVRRNRQRQQPDFLAARLIDQARAAPDPATAVGLLHNAIDTDPDGRETLSSCANWFYSHECWADAADAYAALLRISSSSMYEMNYAAALTKAGHLDEALAELQHLLAATVAGSDHDEVLSQLAFIFCTKGDPSQGLAFANQADLRKRKLTTGGERSLRMRAVCRYLLGQKAAARDDLDRLYAMSASSDIAEMKTRMSDGSFELDAPKPYPDWYPSAVSVMEGPEVEAVPDEHPEALTNGDLSPDGHWRWTGSEWEEVSQAGPAPSVEETESHDQGQIPATAGSSAETEARREPVTAPANGSSDVVLPVGGAVLAPMQPAREGHATATGELSDALELPQPSPAVSNASASIEVTDSLDSAAPSDMGSSIVAETPTSGEIAAGPSPGTKPTIPTEAGSDRFSPDGAWWWNGNAWVSAYSADGQWRWNGNEWKTISAEGGNLERP